MVKRNPLFDSIKGIAIIGIMFVHLGGWNPIVPSGSVWEYIKFSGLLGVELTYLVNAYFLQNHISVGFVIIKRMCMFLF